MHSDLFFIPVLSEALRRPDDADALRQAFSQIQAWYGKPGHVGAGEPWRRFLDAVRDSVESSGISDGVAETAVRMTLCRILNGAEPPDRDGDRSQLPSWQSWSRFVAIVSECADRPTSVGLQIQREGELIVTFPIPPGDNAWVQKARPGHYSVSLDTGQVLWSGQLKESDLCWRAAFPGRPLRAAAESIPSTATPSQRIPLPVGKLVIIVYPGIETGSLRLAEDELET